MRANGKLPWGLCAGETVGECDGCGLYSELLYGLCEFCEADVNETLAWEEAHAEVLDELEAAAVEAYAEVGEEVWGNLPF